MAGNPRQSDPLCGRFSRTLGITVAAPSYRLAPEHPYPAALDDRTVSNPAVAHNYRMWNERSNRFAWASYLGGADPDVAVPARRTDFAGLPAAWIGVGTADLFHEEDVAYAERLRSAGVPCDLEVVDGAFHVFDRIHSRAQVSRAYFDSQCKALRAALEP